MSIINKKILKFFQFDFCEKLTFKVDKHKKICYNIYADF